MEGDPRRTVLFGAPILGLGLGSGSETARADWFIRGDADASGRLTITDPIRIFHHLVLGDLSAPPCLDAADADDNGKVELTDGIIILQYLFQGNRPFHQEDFPSPLTRASSGVMGLLSSLGVMVSSQLWKPVLRICTPMGEAWFLETMGQILPGGNTASAGRLLDGSATLEEIRAVHRASMELLGIGGRDGSLAAALTVLVAHAAALAHHGIRFAWQDAGGKTTGRQEELDDLLVELAAVAPGPWSDLFTRALEAAPRPQAR